MANDIKIVIVFVIVIIAICKIWNMHAMQQYKKSKKNSLSLTYDFYVDSMDELEIVGVGNDENGDYDVVQAIKKVDLPDNVRIKIYE